MASILVDCDGVLGDFTDYLLRLIGSDRTIEDVTRWNIFDFIEEWHGENAKQRSLDLCDDPQFWAAQPVLPGAQEAVDAFRSAGYRVKCVTSPWDTCKEWDYQRRAWLRRYFGMTKKDVISMAEKDDLRGAAFIDDKPDHVKQWAETNPDDHAFIYDAAYNRLPAFEWPRRVCWIGRPDLLDAGAVLETL